MISTTKTEEHAALQERPTAKQRRTSAIRPAVLEDYDGIATLQARNGLKPPSSRDWARLWKDNPAYESRPGWEMGWVAETHDREIVASIVNLPLDYCFRGRRLRVATACGWAVDADYRSYSITLMHRFLTQQSVDLFLCTTVSPQAERTMQFLKMLRVPSGHWNQSEFWITNFKGFAQAVLRHRSVPMAPLASYPAALALFCLDKVSRKPMHSNREEWQLALCPCFDARFDTFWDTLLAENPETLLGVRSLTALRWHFRALAESESMWVLGAFRDLKLVAYAVFDRRDNAANGLRRIRLIDAQALSGNAPAVKSMLAWMLAECRRAGIHVLEVPGAWLERLRGTGVSAPYRRPTASWTQYYKATNESLARELENPAVWAPSSFDGDASIWEPAPWV